MSDKCEHPYSQREGKMTAVICGACKEVIYLDGTGRSPVSEGDARVELTRATCRAFAKQGCERCDGHGWHRDTDPRYAGWRYCDCAIAARNASPGPAAVAPEPTLVDRWGAAQACSACLHPGPHKEPCDWFTHERTVCGCTVGMAPAAIETPAREAVTAKSLRLTAESTVAIDALNAVFVSGGLEEGAGYDGEEAEAACCIAIRARDKEWEGVIAAVVLRAYEAGKAAR